MFTSAIKSKHLIVRSISLNPYYGISQTWKSGIMKKKKKESNSIVSLYYIVDVSYLTNRPFYMRRYKRMTIKASKVIE